MLQPFTAQYLQVTRGLADTTVSVRSAALTDNDRQRGNTEDEAVTRTGGTGEIFDGFANFLPIGPEPPLSLADFERRFDDGEISITVIPHDGTSLIGALGLQDFNSTGPFGEFTAIYLFDQHALTSVGKTLADITGLGPIFHVNHPLRCADLGFTASRIPVPERAPALNLGKGTAGDDILVGTVGDDLIRSGDGNVVIQLEGDCDTITVLHADCGIVSNLVFTDDIFVGCFRHIGRAARRRQRDQAVRIRRSGSGGLDQAGRTIQRLTRVNGGWGLWPKCALQGKYFETR